MRDGNGGTELHDPRQDALPNDPIKAIDPATKSNITCHHTLGHLDPSLPFSLSLSLSLSLEILSESFGFFRLLSDPIWSLLSEQHPLDSINSIALKVSEVMNEIFDTTISNMKIDK